MKAPQIQKKPAPDSSGREVLEYDKLSNIREDVSSGTTLFVEEIRYRKDVDLWEQVQARASIISYAPQMEAKSASASEENLLIPEEVSIFAHEEQLEAALRIAVDLIKENIPSLREIRASLRQDQDEQKRWVKLTAYVEAKPKEILKASGQLLKKWADNAPVKSKNSIRFHYKFSK